MSRAQGSPRSWETDGDVVTRDRRGWNEGTEAEITQLMTQSQEVAGPDQTTASVTVLDPDVDLGPEREAVIEWNAPVYDELGIHRQALVSDGIPGLAFTSLADLPAGMEIETFDDTESAMTRARD